MTSYVLNVSGNRKDKIATILGQSPEGKEPEKEDCSTLCGCKATGIIKVTDLTSLAICDECREKIDEHHKFEFIRFGRIEWIQKEEQNE
jgi:hypothetical protein